MSSLVLVVALGMGAGTSGQQPAPSSPFAREGKPEERAKKDPLEGKAPPDLKVGGWLNTDGKPLRLAELRGKVVLLDFWGVW